MGNLRKRTANKLAVLLTILLGVAALPAISEEKGVLNTARAGDYEVHEWGVIVGCDSGGNGILTSRPMRITVVKEPVLYFHSRDKRPFSLKVAFNRGAPTETYPAAVKKGNVIEWKRVSFPAQTKAVITKSLAADNLVPFDEIIDTLNDTDADEIESGGTKARFLFYEGETPFANPVKMNTDPRTHEVMVTNTGSYLLLDLWVIFRDPLNAGGLVFQPDISAFYLPRLQPGETVRLKPELAGTTLDFAKPLRELGFTEKEARSFEMLWQDSFLKYGKFVYRLPEEECNRMIKLEFNPQPKKISRALYVLVKY
ncbi:MAG: hypothetical protein ACM3YE_07785 [Bacteroidota bacterium]